MGQYGRPNLALAGILVNITAVRHVGFRHTTFKQLMVRGGGNIG